MMKTAQENLQLAAEHEFLVLYVFTKNYLKDSGARDLQRLERELLIYFDSDHKDILGEIKEKRGISSALAQRIEFAIAKFKAGRSY